MTLKIYTDGGSKGNPGPSSIGMVFYFDGKKVFAHREDIGIGTNNRAEYMAVIGALEQVKSQKSKVNPDLIGVKSISKIEVYSDSRLLVHQVKGLFKVKNASIREFILKMRILEREIGLPISYHLIPREKNTVADGLVNDITS